MFFGNIFIVLATCNFNIRTPKLSVGNVDHSFPLKQLNQNTSKQHVKELNLWILRFPRFVYLPIFAIFYHKFSEFSVPTSTEI